VDGVQTYFASKAVQVLVLTFYPGAESVEPTPACSPVGPRLVRFSCMWLFQLLIFLNGMETIRKFPSISAGPSSNIVMFALAIWILAKNRHVEPSLQLSPRSKVPRSVTCHAAMLIVGLFFAALLLNFR